MYLKELKTLLTMAGRKVFDADYYEPDFRDLWVDIEFPAAEQAYPGLWVDFMPTQSLHTIGIGHVEYVDTDSSHVRPYKRWVFQGNVSYTAVALSSLERDRLVDELVRVLAFGDENPQTEAFRQYIEDNPLLALNFDFDTIGVGGMAATPGTPWGTDDIVYEATITMECLGEFVSDSSTGELVRLTDIILEPYLPGQDPDPSWG